MKKKIGVFSLLISRFRQASIRFHSFRNYASTFCWGDFKQTVKLFQVNQWPLQYQIPSFYHFNSIFMFASFFTSFFSSRKMNECVYMMRKPYRIVCIEIHWPLDTILKFNLSARHRGLHESERGEE